MFAPNDALPFRAVCILLVTPSKYPNSTGLIVKPFADIFPVNVVVFEKLLVPENVLFPVGDIPVVAIILFICVCILLVIVDK